MWAFPPQCVKAGEDEDAVEKLKHYLELLQKRVNHLTPFPSENKLCLLILLYLVCKTIHSFIHCFFFFNAVVAFIASLVFNEHLYQYTLEMH